MRPIADAPDARRGASPAPLRVPADATAPAARARTVAGRVVRSPDGAPLAGVRLDVQTDAGWARAESGADGSFRLADLDPYASMLHVSARIGEGETSRQVVVPGGWEDVPDLEVLLDTGSVCEGRVEAEVRRGQRDWWSLRSAPQGTFPTLVPGVVVREREVSRVEVALPEGAVLAGRVLDERGAPRAGAMLHVLSRSWRAPEAGALSGADGAFRIEGLSAGEFDVIAVDAETWPVETRRRFVLRGDEQVLGQDFVLAEGRSLRGRVTDERGDPVTGARVSVDDSLRGSATIGGHGVTTGPDGSFEMAGLPAAPVALSIAHADHAVLHALADPAAPPATFELLPAVLLHGEVVDAASGLPVERFGVRLEFPDCTQWIEMADHAAGAFAIEVAQESCSVTVAAPGYALASRRDLVPAATAGAPARFAPERQP